MATSTSGIELCRCGVQLVTNKNREPGEPEKICPVCSPIRHAKVMIYFGGYGYVEEDERRQSLNAEPEKPSPQGPDFGLILSLDSRY